MTPYHILLVEDEADIREFMRNKLIAEGYRVSVAENIKYAENFLQNNQPHLIILDIVLPDGSGLDLCRNIRGISQAPVLFVTNMGEKSQIVQGLRAGADDYIVKPFDINELVARIEALLRRTAKNQTDTIELPISQLILEPENHRARWAGKDFLLSPKEYRILNILLRNRNRFTSAQELFSEVWGMSAYEDIRTVKVHISGLRRKLYQTAGDDTIKLVSRKERGYRLEFADSKEGLSHEK